MCFLEPDFEVDFPDVCKRKSGLILKHSMPLLSIIEGMSPADAAVAVAAATAAADEHRLQAAGKLSLGGASPSSPASAAESAPAPAADKSPSAAPVPVAAAGSDCIYLQSSDYALLHADLRDIEQLERNLRLAGIDFEYVAVASVLIPLLGIILFTHDCLVHFVHCFQRSHYAIFRVRLGLHEERRFRGMLASPRWSHS